MESTVVTITRSSVVRVLVTKNNGLIINRGTLMHDRREKNGERFIYAVLSILRVFSEPV